MDPTPRELVDRARRGDAAAFSMLIRRYERSALAVAFGLLGSGSRAGDVVQDAFLRAWQKLREVRDPDRFGPWLCGIVHNLAIDAKRREGKRSEASFEAPSPALCWREGPVEQLDRIEEQARVAAALQTLDELSRCAVVLRYYEDLGSREIGELLGLSPAAVDMRLSRARQLLRERLEPGKQVERVR